MSIGINPRKARCITLESDQAAPPERRTLWLVYPITAAQRLAFVARWGNDIRKVLEGDRASDAVRSYLEMVHGGWENLRDAEGEQVPVPRTSAGDPDRAACCDCMSLEDMTALFIEALKRDILTETQRGKSSPPSTPPTA